MPSYPDEPDILLPFPGKPPLPRFRRIYLLLGLLFLGFLIAHNAVPLYTDWLWFGEVGYRNVFATTVLAKTSLFFGFGALFFLLFYLNLRYARHVAPEQADRFLMERFGPAWGQAAQRTIGWILFAVAVFFSLWAGRLAAESWSSALEFLNATPFRVTDPVFGNDVSFYVFKLPFLRFIWTFLLTTLVLTGVAVVFIHVADRAIESWAGLPNIHPGVRAQLLLLTAAMALTHAFGTRLNAYDLLTNDNGVFSGAGYADVHYRLLAYNVQTFLLVLTALACLVALWQKRDFRWPVIGVAAWLASVVLLGAVIPGTMQKVYVEPNQAALEQEYIKRNIQFTRLGFGLQNVRRVNDFPADESLTTASLHSNQDTLDNVRLWDYPYLGKVYDQTQTVKTYYRFQKSMPGGSLTNNVDVDRYVIGGKLRQVMLAAREMNPTGLSPDARTWQNERLGYTHGYGIVMSPVNRSTAQGDPDYFLKDIPPTASKEAAELKVTQPKIYYGQLASDYVFVDTAQQEFDPVEGGPDAERNYHGRGGIRIGDAPLAKLAFSLNLGDANVLLAKGFTADTRVLIRRDIRERVQLVAPFVQQDSDPYIVLTAEGKLVWIIDCYTLADRYPYSTALTVGVAPSVELTPNYIRNSVKATVDAYDGTVNLYLADPTDPIAQTYAKIFPGLLKPLDAMPKDLRAHLRYPEDLFRLQRSVYATYHVDDPGVFYRKEDAWGIPNEPNTDTANAGTPQQMEPYYVIMRLPTGENGAVRSNEEFLMMSPLAPIRQEDKNILGWMCARCDGDHYGELVLYRFPQQKSVNGPTQILSLVNSDSDISKELSLLRSSGGGSTASFGNLLVIPVEKSLLYIAPLYIESSNASKIPQLQRVVVAYGNDVRMGRSLAEALEKLFSDYQSGPTEPETTAPPSTTNPPPGGAPTVITPAFHRLIEDAAKQYDVAQQKLKAGDFAGYGEATKALEQTLRQLKTMAK